MAERYRSLPDLGRLPLGGGRELAYDPLGRAAHELDAADARLLAGCRAFATLDEHAARLAAGGPGDVRRRLGELARLGLLVADAGVPGPGGPAPPVPPVASVGVPTRGRPDLLRACLGSYAASARGCARSFVVIDDSDDPGHRERNRETVRAAAARFGGEYLYGGPGDKARYAAALAREAGLPEEVVRFALVNDDGFPVATGTSRNALLLDAAGGLSVQADDDTLARATPVPGRQDGSALSSRLDPTEFWFLPEGVPDAADAIGLHERLLGRRPADLGGAADTSAASGACLRRAAAGGVVLATVTGLAGGSGMGSVSHLLALDGPSRERLVCSPDLYRYSLASRRLLRAVTRETVSDSPLCMAACLGLDHRGPLPPFPPAQRNQDGVFGALLRACCGGFTGYLPWAVEHRPPAPQDIHAADFWPRQARFDSGHLLQALCLTHAPATPPADPADALRATGSALGALAATSPVAFAECVSLHLARAASQRAVALEGLLRQHGGPAHWADDARRLLEAVRAAAVGPAVPADLAAAFGRDRAVGMFQVFVGRFGRLLRAWPEVVAAARALRARGVRPAGPA